MIHEAVFLHLYGSNDENIKHTYDQGIHPTALFEVL